MSYRLDDSLLNNSSVRTSNSLFEAISIRGILIDGDDAGEGLGSVGIKFTFCRLTLDVGVVGGVAQTECNVVVDGVVAGTEFCLLGGPKAGKSSWGSFALTVVDVAGVLGGTTLLRVCDKTFPEDDAAFWDVGLNVVVDVVVDDDDVGNGVIALTTFGSVDVSGVSVDFFEK